MDWCGLEQPRDEDGQMSGGGDCIWVKVDPRSIDYVQQNTASLIIRKSY